MNQAGLDLIKHFEGFRPIPYLCPAKIWTIGYGHTRTVKVGMTITEAQADELLQEDIRITESGVKRVVRVPLNENQEAALVCFAFNVGLGNFNASSLLKLLNNGWTEQVPIQLLRWNRASGKVLQGLELRRRAEGLLWNLPVEPQAQAVA